MLSVVRRLSQMDVGELKIGYGFTDFVVEDGRIEAALVAREEKMETIRVLIKTSGYANSVHQTVELFADCDCRILNVERELTALEKGQHLVITRDSPLFDQTGRITIEPKILTGHLMLSGVERAQGQANYRGRLELVAPGGWNCCNQRAAAGRIPLWGRAGRNAGVLSTGSVKEPGDLCQNLCI